MTIVCDNSLEQALRDICAIDPRLVPVRNAVGRVPLRKIPADFSGLARVIVGQQVSAKAASSIFARLETVVSPLEPDVFLSAGEDAWRAAGLSRPKQRALANAARAVVDDGLDLHMLAHADAADAISALTVLPGIGPWTAEVYLLFAAGHADIFPARDLALQEAVRRLDAAGERPDEKTLIRSAERWRPLRSAAARLLWAAYSLDPAHRDS